MSNIARSLTANSSRPLPVRMRPDIHVRTIAYQGRKYWVLKDPVSLKYYRFEDEEYAILAMLDGQASADDIIAAFQRKYAPQRLSLGALHRLLGMLHRSALIISSAPGQGKQLSKRKNENDQQQRWAAVSNILSIRFKGFDPDWILTYLNDLFGWVFSLPGMCAAFGLALFAITVVMTDFEHVQRRLPGMDQFFAAENWIYLALTLTVTKVLHELGHGLACKRFGGECHEMGVMFLVLTPCLYCNVSDSWMLPSKWKRAAIAAAGMYVEMIVASIATILWWYSQPGLFNSLCLNVMVVCSITTFLFNINPLLRYDGYYILSDLLEIPNLRQKASTILNRKLQAWFLGMPEPHDPFLPKKWQGLFALYSVAAGLYRWLIAFSIFWVLYNLLEPYGLKVLGQMIAGAALFSLLGLPLYKAAQFFLTPGRLRKVKTLRLAGTLAVVAAVIAGVLLIPLPHWVTCTLHVQPRGAAAAYVDAPGELREVYVKPGDTVNEGDRLVSLDSVDIRLNIEKLEGERATLFAQLQSLRRREFIDPEAGREVTSVEKAIESADDQLAKLRLDRERLIVRAPASGVIISPPRRDAPAPDADILPEWSGKPLDVANVGATYGDDVMVCRVGDPHQLEAILAIDQTEVEYLLEEQRVELFFHHLPSRYFISSVKRISQVKMEAAPESMSAKKGGSLATATSRQGYEKPLGVMYQAAAPVNDPRGEFFIGATGYAKVYVGNRTLGQRLWRYLCHTFNFEM